MFCILEGHGALLRPGHFPDWVNLCCLVTLGGDRDVERHYHHYEEVWLWREGTARVWNDGVEFEIQPGQLSYTPAQREHSFDALGEHMMTLIVPRIPQSTSWGHLHLDETQEDLAPPHKSQLLTAEQTALDSPFEFPPHAFARQMLGGRCVEDYIIFDGTADAWLAVLVDKGSVEGRVDGEAVSVTAGQCLCIHEASLGALKAMADSEIVLLRGWPS